MSVTVYLQSESTRRRLYRRDNLTRLAERICAGEGIAGDVEVSVLFCDDDGIRALNKQYRAEDKATDVLSFEQDGFAAPGPRVLGDIVISLETAEERHPGNPAGMRDEVRLLFCHGLLHLLGHDHQNPEQRRQMTALQARYLGVDLDSAWFSHDKHDDGKHTRE
jgi:probable rRNA maturation factor